MATDTNAYPLSSDEFEQERLVRQAAWTAPHTERLFLRAGIGPGQRVLELGSGVGDVSLILARLVGDSGEVVGVERDPRSILRASARIRELGLSQGAWARVPHRRGVANREASASRG
jgi:tRNA A58 N-methylase Trm61